MTAIGIMSNIHDLKLNRQFFPDVKSGKKSFELRKNDRNYQVGDFLRLKEWTGEYTGEYIDAVITYIVDEYTCIGLQTGFVILGIKLLTI